MRPLMLLEVLNGLEPSEREIIELDLMIFRAIKQYRLMDLNVTSALQIRDRLKLVHFFNFFDNFNDSYVAPYHNSYHSYCMVNNCYEGAYHHGLQHPRALIVAALFHDFDHSAGYQNDDVNISRALVGLSNAQRYASSNGTGLTTTELEDAINAIKVTRFPFTVEPINTEQKIIRDADLMQIYEMNDVVLYKQFSGLKAEIEVREGRSLTDDEFGVGNGAFLDQTSWFTSWAIEKALIRDWEACKKRHVKMFTKFRY